MKFPRSYPYLNKKGFHITSRMMESAAEELLDRYGRITQEAGLEVADALARVLDTITSYKQLVNNARKLFNYRRRRQWIPKEYYDMSELDPRISSGAPNEDDILEMLDKEKLLEGLTYLNASGTLKEIDEHTRELLRKLIEET